MVNCFDVWLHRATTCVKARLTPLHERSNMSDRKISLQLTVSSSDSESESDKCVVSNILNRTFHFSVELSFALERRQMFLPWTIRFQSSMVVRRRRGSEGPRQSTPKVRLSSVSLDLSRRSGRGGWVPPLCLSLHNDAWDSFDVMRCICKSPLYLNNS